MKIQRLLKRLEHTIDTEHPENGIVPIKVLGFGEISLVFELLDPDASGRAYKRLPIFSTEREVSLYGRAYRRYNAILEKVGLELPRTDVSWFRNPRGNIALYCEQERVPPQSVGHQIIHHVSPMDVENLFRAVLGYLQKVWTFNQEQARDQSDRWINVGLDGQISNWAVVDYDLQNPHVDPGCRLIYLDTSTPLYRICTPEKAVYAFNPTLFLKSAPSFLRWFLKLAFLDEVVERYHDLRKVIIDLIANFFKEQKSEFIPRLVAITNQFLQSEGQRFGIQSITVDEIQKYYKSDKQIWVIFQGMRRLDRFLQTRLLKKQYDFYLPEKIAR